MLQYNNKFITIIANIILFIAFVYYRTGFPEYLFKVAVLHFFNYYYYYINSTLNKTVFKYLVGHLRNTNMVMLVYTKSLLRNTGKVNITFYKIIKHENTVHNF